MERERWRERHRENESKSERGRQRESQRDFENRLHLLHTHCIATFNLAFLNCTMNFLRLRSDPPEIESVHREKKKRFGSIFSSLIAFELIV